MYFVSSESIAEVSIYFNFFLYMTDGTTGSSVLIKKKYYVGRMLVAWQCAKGHIV